MNKTNELLITKYDLLFESRLTRVETTNEKLTELLEEHKTDFKETIKALKSDFKWIIGIMFVCQGALLTAIAKGFHWI